ncbi:MAG: hypothetical protein WC538_13415, partial [Thermoanaerobaculia bacterium]
VGVAGTYTVTVTNDTDCTKTADHVLTVNALPEPKGSEAAVCEGTKQTFTAGGPYKSYAWAGPNGFTADTQTIEVGVAGTYTVTVTNDTNCTKTATHTLSTYELPKPEGSKYTVCEGEEHTFDAGAGFASYSWTGPGEFKSAEQTITVKVAGTYTVTVINENKCEAKAYHELIVNPLPPAEITVVGEVCAGSMNNSASTRDAGDGAAYEWTIANGTITSATPYGRTIMFTAGEDATTHVVLNVTVTSLAGCKRSDDAQVLNKPCTEGCSLTQGAWGSLGGAGSLAQVQLLIGLNGLQVGYGGNTFTVRDVDAPCLVQVLPAGGSPKALAGNGIFTSGQSKCTTNPPMLAKNTGKLNNVFLGQMLAFALNMRDNDALAQVALCATMRTQAILKTADGDVLNPGADGILGTADDPVVTVTIPQSVLSALDAAGLPRTVAGLFELANKALGGVNVGATVADFNAAVNAINVGFDGCRIKIDCLPVSTLSPQAMQLVSGEQSIELCNTVATFDRFGEQRDLEFADSVLNGISALNLPVDLKGLARLAEMARLGESAGVPLDDLNSAIDGINAVAAEGRVIGGCEWQ